MPSVTSGGREVGDVVATEEISVEKYQSLQRHGYAGDVSELSEESVALFRAGAEDWDGQHWHMHNGGARGTMLSPVNVRAGHQP